MQFILQLQGVQTAGPAGEDAHDLVRSGSTLSAFTCVSTGSYAFC
ncbi:hypothetical protein O7599_22680 [Streptomyces sp. WMMC500]|nr:SapB/AmfS family lanthipeptide [Streptomyces sp. WMMC500]WBB58433.1 hypothetical protein O7599_22680 [Streptomyces sp. WMMC500]